MAIELREAVIADHPWISSQHGDIYEAEFGFSREFEAGIEGKLEKFASDTSGRRWLWIAESGGQRIGSIGLSEIRPGVSFINFVLAVPAARGLGLGEMLLDHVIRWSREQGMGTIELETYSCLEAARILYQRAGFTVIREHRGRQLFGQKVDQEFWQLKPG